MDRQTKWILGGAAAIGGITAITLAFGKARQESSFPPVSRSGGLIVRNYFGQSGSLSSVYPRGIRNNNPGNLKIGPSPWTGKIPVDQNTDGQFEQFSTFEYGLRAMIKQLKNDIDKGYNTLVKLISKYAPPSENRTADYIKYVAAQTGIRTDAGLISTKPALKNLVKTMVRYENGNTYPVSEAQFETAYNLL